MARSLPRERRDRRDRQHERASRSARRADGGQVLVIFALSITVLFAAAGLAFDVGRFYSERRFLQNAADAAALAAANALIRGDTAAEADAQARDILARNFLNSPSGITPSQPPTTPVYASGYAGNASYLLDGILLPGRDTNTGSAIRVAVQNSLGYTFGRLATLSNARVFGTIQNVFTATGYSGVDPTAGVNGIDNNLYPRSRTFLGGLSVNF